MKGTFRRYFTLFTRGCPVWILLSAGLKNVYLFSDDYDSKENENIPYCLNDHSSLIVPTPSHIYFLVSNSIDARRWREKHSKNNLYIIYLPFDVYKYDEAFGLQREFDKALIIKIVSPLCGMLENSTIQFQWLISVPLL